ncbi:hypothetical protein CKJ81_04110 [Corynebacterium hadale]|uniref:Uncharacterized protein n=3 Tax=Corynebacterium TaxID=1716 RepID=A0A269PEM6_9CORY|nr:hypothetical protein CIG21_07930 [Corynebacterium hadale]PAT04424.1 hypothetical protein CKJ85_03200 [Corynebacterium sp. NML 150383]PAT14225.1 hypothetical protein CKJ84_09365 [Corynebacterium sp. NML 120412]RMD20707.1 hypothetical protein EAW56_01015 [Corynebacterium gottingense]PAT06617.1 hypothetical protein CKJ81_04110 [Corynebacterium hadale]
MVMDFAEFAEQYRRRTQKRMLDFEAMLRDNQRKMAQTAKYHAMAQANPNKPPLVVPRGEYSYPLKTSKLLQPPEDGQKPIRAVLRREPPNGRRPR